MAEFFVPPYDPDNVNVGLASGYWRPYDRNTPATLPPEDQDAGELWAPPWVQFGASDSGLESQFSRKTNQIMIEESETPVDEPTESVTFSINITLAEDTFRTISLAYGGGTITTVAPGVSTPGIRRLRLSPEAAFITVGYEVMNELGFWRRFLIPKAKSIADVKTTYSRQKDKRAYEVSIKSLCSIKDVVIDEQTALPTGP